jgi:hypothetical protein
LATKTGASSVTDLKISGLRRRDRCEQRPIRLEVKQRRLVDAIKAAHVDGAALNSLKQRNRGTDRIGAGGGSQRECAAGVAIVGRALENKIPPREMQPVEYFDPRICLKTLQRRYPRFENLDPAYWTVHATLPRGHESGGPRSTDAPDKYEPGVGSGRGLDGNLSLANFVLANHRYLFHVRQLIDGGGRATRIARMKHRDYALRACE